MENGPNEADHRLSASPLIAVYRGISTENSCYEEIRKVLKFWEQKQKKICDDSKDGGSRSEDGTSFHIETCDDHRIECHRMSQSSTFWTTTNKHLIKMSKIKKTPQKKLWWVVKMTNITSFLFCWSEIQTVWSLQFGFIDKVDPRFPDFWTCCSSNIEVIH